MDIIEIRDKALQACSKLPFNKYVVTLGLAAVWMICFDENSIPTRLEYEHKIHSLKKEIEHYKKEIEDTKKRTIELQTNDLNLEKFAREQYLMKKADEDIFIIED
ncbi:MAG: septum formation initiator family protein [Paludibacteraceae bacterium]|nr:septum formation initiator family protein [Paludibacteraceae bacterium]